MKVELLVAHKRFGKVGQVVDLSDVLAEQLIAKKLAKSVTRKTDKKEVKKDKKDKE